MPKTITTIGSLNTDLITTTRRMPMPGETIASTSFTTAAGGKGANQAVAAVRLAPSDGSVKCTMFGAVGADSFGRDMKAALARDGIDVAGVREVADGTPTGTAVIIVDESSGENRILFHAGANASVTVSDFPPDFFTTYPTDLLLLQLETPLPTVLHLISLAASANVRVLLNPAPAVPLPLQHYAQLSYLIVNETEAAFLAGETAGADALATLEGVEAAARRLQDRGVAAAVVVTLGARGAFWIAGAEKGWTPVEQMPGEVVDTTGAGDTFVGAFAVAIVEGCSMAEAVAFAGRAAGKAVRKKGAMAAVPWRNELAW